LCVVPLRFRGSQSIDVVATAHDLTLTAVCGPLQAMIVGDDGEPFGRRLALNQLLDQVVGIVVVDGVENANTVDVGLGVLATRSSGGVEDDDHLARFVSGGDESEQATAYPIEAGRPEAFAHQTQGMG
jgi:hypothetical protein